MISRAARAWYCILICLILYPSLADATWQRVFFVTGRAFTSGFFFSELRGIIATVDNNVFYLTTDGGRTWTPANSVPFTFPGAISQIVMTDTLRGWASVEEPPSQGHPRQQIWRTMDGGRNWTAANLADTGNFSCIYETSRAITVTSRSPRYNALRSLDGGATFQPGGFNVTNGVDFVDDLHGVMTGFKNTPWKYTNDGGLTWQNITPNITDESWGIYGWKGTQTFFASPERDPTIRGNTGNSPVWRSTNYGVTWQNVHTFPFFTTGHLAGAKGKVYVQVENISTNGAYTGLYRSDDNGVTWVSVGGPERFQDERFFVTGCNGGVVYAFDDAGGVWKTRDGGNGGVFEPNPEPLFTGLPITFSSRICATSFTQVRVANQYCDSLRILDVSFVDPNVDAVKSGAISIVNSADFPSAIEGGGQDSIEFMWDPSKYLHTDTTVSFQVRIRYFSEALFTVRDTVLTISADAIGDEPTLTVAPLIVDLQSIPFCTPVDSIFSLANTGCDTLFIVSASAGASARYVLLDNAGNPVSYPVQIPPGASFTYRVRITMTRADNYTSSVSLRLRHQGKFKDTSVFIHARSTSDGAYSAPLLLDFGKVSICAPMDSFVVIGNLACDTMFLSSSALGAGSEFSIIANPTPASVYPDSTKRITLRYAPTDLGVDYDTLVINLTTLGDAVAVRVVIRGEGTSGDAMLVMAPGQGTLFDLTMTRCDTAQRFDIALSNPGCKQLQVIEARLEGAPSNNIALTSSLPANLRLGSGTGVSVAVTPKEVGSTSGVVRIRYQIEGEAERDTILFYALTVNYGKRVLAVNNDSIDFGRFHLCTQHDTTIVLRNTGCDTLDLSSVIFQGASDETWSQPGKMQLGPGDTTSIHYYIAPASAGLRSSSFTITSVTDSTNPLVIRLRADITPTDTIRLTVAPVRFPFYVGDTITIQIIPENPVDISFGLRDIAFTLLYNGDLLTMIPSETRTFPQGTTHLAGNISTNYPKKQIAQRFFISGTPYIAFPANVPIVEFRFYVSLTDSTNTALEIAGIELNGNSPTFSRCVLGFTSSAINLDLALRCGDSLLREFMRKGNKFTLSTAPVFPDPLTSQNGYAATLSFELQESALATLYIYDGNGKAVWAENHEATQGINRMRIDGRNLPGGAYTYLLYANGEASSGRFVIQR